MTDGRVAFLVGRMNPPTPGHIELIHSLLEYADKHDATPLAYVTLSSNLSKMTAKQKKMPIVGLAKSKGDASDERPFVKHKSYENPLEPIMKKKLIQLMLLNKFGVPMEESAEVVRIDQACNGIYRAMSCVREIQPDPSKITFVMGKETDEAERAEREKLCLTKSDGSTVAQTDDGKLVECHFLERAEGEGLGVSGISGSKVRLLAADGDLEKLMEVYDGYLTREQVEELMLMVRAGLNMKIEELSEDSPSPVIGSRRPSSGIVSSRPESAPSTRRRRMAGRRNRRDTHRRGSRRLKRTRTRRRHRRTIKKRRNASTRRHVRV